MQHAKFPLAVMAALMIAPAAVAADEVAIAIQACTPHTVKADAYVRIQTDAAPLTVTVAHNGVSQSYDVTASDQSFPLGAFVGGAANGAWTLQAARDFVAEMHIRNNCGLDGAEPGQGGPLAPGCHPQIFVPTLVWEETTNEWLLEKPFC